MSNGEKPHGDEDGDVWREGPPSWDDNALCKKPIADVRDFFTSKMASEARYDIVDDLKMPAPDESFAIAQKLQSQYQKNLKNKVTAALAEDSIPESRDSHEIADLDQLIQLQDAARLSFKYLRAEQGGASSVDDMKKPE